MIDGKEGSLQEFIEDAEVGQEVKYEEIDQNEMAKLKLFDQLICNGDRHGGNYLVKGGKIFAIDHGFTLKWEDLQLDRYIFIDDVPFDTINKIIKFVESEEQGSILRDLIVELLGEPVADQFMKRVNAFAKSINKDFSFNQDKFDILMRL